MDLALTTFEPQLGIVTALALEYLAMKVLIDDSVEIMLDELGKCLLGRIHSGVSGSHNLVLAQAGMGNNAAVLCAEKLHNKYPSLDTIIMVGIAGAVPDLQKPENHVRLGDIVVVGKMGIAQYDFVKQGQDNIEYRYPPRPPKTSLLRAAEILQREEEEGKYPWNEFIQVAIEKRGLQWKRPPASTDKIMLSSDTYAKHPRDPKRRKGEPRIFLGRIASGNILLKDPATRDRLRNDLGARAVEMEAAGIADAAWANEINYFAVRGTCDYCDGNKNDIWQNYAAIVAASYTKALLRSIPGAYIETSKNDPLATIDSSDQPHKKNSRIFRIPLCEVEILFDDFIGDLPPILQVNKTYGFTISISAIDEVPLDYAKTRIGVFVICPNAEVRPDSYQDIRVPVGVQAMNFKFRIALVEIPSSPHLDLMLLFYHETTFLTSLSVKISCESQRI